MMNSDHKPKTRTLVWLSLLGNWVSRSS